MPVSSRAVVRRRLLRLVPVALTAVSGGCYTYGPMPASSRGADHIAVELLLNERGRADLVDRIGPDALSLEGSLTSRQDSAVTVNVQSVRYINQSVTRWTGESLVVSNAQLRDIRQRQFSKSKTFAAIGVAVGGVVAFIVTRSLTGGGDSPPPGGGGGGVSQ